MGHVKPRASAHRWRSFASPKRLFKRQIPQLRVPRESYDERYELRPLGELSVRRRLVVLVDAVEGSNALRHQPERKRCREEAEMLSNHLAPVDDILQRLSGVNRIRPQVLQDLLFVDLDRSLVLSVDTVR